MTDPARFVEKIWSLQGIPEAFGRLARKNWDAAPEDEDWEEIPVRPNQEIPDMVQTSDWYFAPCLFSGPRRRSDALPSRLLWADLDQVSPDQCKDVPPTIAWETSPGRYQAIWILDRPLAVVKKDGKPGAFEDLNRQLTYYIRADKGGWSSTKVLRPPGTISTKYGKSRAKKWKVRLVQTKGPRYALEDLTALLKTHATKLNEDNHQWQRLPELDEVLRKWKHQFTPRIRRLRRAARPMPGDDRSARLWELHNILLELGLSPEETLVVARASAWNKYRGQRRELPQLKLEITKAAEVRRGQVVERGELERVRNASKNGHSGGLSSRQLQAWTSRQESVGLGYFTYREFLGARFPEPQWLVEGFWGRGAYGVWAGEFKSYKTITLLDFALSVASGKPFLGRFGVQAPGGVLYAHDEGTPGLIQDRLRRIAARKGLAGSAGRNGNKLEVEFELDLPLHVSSWPKLNLTEIESQDKLKNYCGAIKPSVIILESFYLMAQDVDENSAREVTPALTFLKELAHDNNLSVVISHHYNKSADEGKRPGLRMSGSSVFGRWYESAVYLERKGDETEGRAIISAEHREQRGTGKMGLKVEMDVEAEDHYEVEIVEASMKLSGETHSDASNGRKGAGALHVPCPVCKAMPGTRCTNSRGQMGYHPSRRRVAEAME